MPFSLIPDRVLRRYTDLTPALLERWGIRLLLCDLDYTLAPRSVARPDQALRTWLADLAAAGGTGVIRSANRAGRRGSGVGGQLGWREVGQAGKPSVRGYREAMALAGRQAEETAMVGDKLLTDVLGARRSGVLALMVEPLGGPVGPWNKLLHLLQRPFKAIAKRRMDHEQI